MGSFEFVVLKPGVVSTVASGILFARFSTVEYVPDHIKLSSDVINCERNEKFLKA